MERADQDLIQRVVPSDPRLKKLYAEHKKLERDIARFQGYSVYSPSAQLKQKELKIQKLRGMDSIMSILSEYRAP